MKIISIFNNKGGVGKSTLAFHLSHALALKGKKTLMIDLDPQSNLTLNAISSKELEEIWNKEEPFIEDLQNALSENQQDLQDYLSEPRSIHSLLKPIEDGVFEEISIGKPVEISENLGLIPGRLSIHSYEDKIAKSWSDAFMGDVTALRLITAIRNLCLDAARKYGYDFAIIDTSPSLGMLNKVIISTSTAFFVPCTPDMFSLFGLKNIGNSLKLWHTQFTTMLSLLSDKKREGLPKQFVKFLGYTIYNAKKYNGSNDWNLAAAHLGYVEKLPEVIESYIPKDSYKFLSLDVIKIPIGGKSVMHSHNTLPSMSQKYQKPIWEIPSSTLDRDDRSTVSGNQDAYLLTRDKYLEFTDDILSRVEKLDAEEV